MQGFIESAGDEHIKTIVKEVSPVVQWKQG